MRYMTSRVDDVVKRLDPWEVGNRHALRMGAAFKGHVWCEAAVREKYATAVAGLRQLPPWG